MVWWGRLLLPEILGYSDPPTSKAATLNRYLFVAPSIIKSINQSISVFNLEQRNVRPMTAVERPKKQNDTNLRQF